MADAGKLVVDKADIWVKTYSSSATNDPVGTTNAVDTTGYTQLGWQADGAGFKLEYTPEFFEGKVADKNGVVKRKLMSEEAKITFTLAESTIDQQQYAIAAGTYAAGAAPGTNADKLGVGDKATFDRWSVVAIYEGEDGRDACVFAGNCVATGSISPEYKKDDFTVLDFEFSIDDDENETAGSTRFALYQVSTA